MSTPYDESTQSSVPSPIDGDAHPAAADTNTDPAPTTSTGTARLGPVTGFDPGVTPPAQPTFPAYVEANPGDVTGPAAITQRQQTRFGGLKLGSAFFGWLAATGLAAILVSLLGAAGLAIGVITSPAAPAATDAAKPVGLFGAIVLAVVLLVAYYCGGYVAGRMARFNGLRQGLAVWLWGIVTALVIAAVAALAGSSFDLFARLNLSVPVSGSTITATGLIVAGAALLAALVGATVGGLAGMRFHRQVDAAG